jgi:hypothetical protein
MTNVILFINLLFNDSQPSSRLPSHPLPLLRHVEKTDL